MCRQGGKFRKVCSIWPPHPPQWVTFPFVPVLPCTPNNTAFPLVIPAGSPCPIDPRGQPYCQRLRCSLFTGGGSPCPLHVTHGKSPAVSACAAPPSSQGDKPCPNHPRRQPVP